MTSCKFPNNNRDESHSRDIILRLQHINFRFSPERQLINNISLSLEQGKVYALMGSNGSGKTTLFNLITGFIKPQAGKIVFFEENISHLKPFKINRLGIARTFQDLRLITKLSVIQNIILAMKQNKTDKWINGILPKSFHYNINASLETKANEITQQFFLNEVKHSKAGEISYGQQKLLTLACCVANRATLLLLDEPVAGIQPEYRNNIVALIRQIKEQGKTILIIEHNTDFISQIADKIFFLHNGKIFDFSNMESLKADQTIMESYT